MKWLTYDILYTYKQQHRLRWIRFQENDYSHLLQLTLWLLLLLLWWLKWINNGNIIQMSYHWCAIKCDLQILILCTYLLHSSAFITHTLLAILAWLSSCLFLLRFTSHITKNDTRKQIDGRTKAKKGENNRIEIIKTSWIAFYSPSTILSWNAMWHSMTQIHWKLF